MNKYHVYYKIVYQEWGGSKCLIGKKDLGWSWSSVTTMKLQKLKELIW